MPLKSRLCVLLVLAVVLLAGCGSDSGPGAGAGEDPAKVVPADAPLYLEAVVRPDGDLEDGANQALAKLLRTDDPGAKLTELLDKATADSDVKWAEVKEWIGPRVGAYVTEFTGEDGVGAVIANVTDAKKAEATLAKIAARSKGKATSAMVGDYAVIGTPEALTAVRATAEGGKSLADAPDFQQATDAAAADDSLGLVYVEPQGLLDVVAGAAGAAGVEGNPFANPQALDSIRQVVAKAGRAAAVTLHADGDAVRIEGATVGAPAGDGSTRAAESLAALPADAWLAIGFGDIGKTISEGLAQLGQLAGISNPKGPNFDDVLGMIESRLGIDVRQDLLSWMGDGAVYARGRGIADIGGALTITTKDAAKSRKAVGTLSQGLAKAGANVRAAEIAGYDVAVEIRSAAAPISVFIAANDERFTIGVNPQAMSDVLDPGERLGDSSAHRTAKEALGGDVEPVAIIDTQTIVGLIEAFGVGQAEGYSEVKPYLEALGPISAGTARDGDVARFSIALALR